MNTYKKTEVGERYTPIAAKLSIDPPFNPVKMHPLKPRLEPGATV